MVLFAMLHRCEPIGLSPSLIEALIIVTVLGLCSFHACGHFTGCAIGTMEETQTLDERTEILSIPWKLQACAPATQISYVLGIPAQDNTACYTSPWRVSIIKEFEAQPGIITHLSLLGALKSTQWMSTADMRRTKCTCCPVHSHDAA